MWRGLFPAGLLGGWVQGRTQRPSKFNPIQVGFKSECFGRNELQNFFLQGLGFEGFGFKGLRFLGFQGFWL